jgi:hypothetical protein
VGATVLSLGHHGDHIARGDHTGWPLTEEVTAFTYSLGVYPIILVGLLLSRRGRAGARFWTVFFGAGVAFLAAVHLGPAALEPRGDIVGGYPSAVLGSVAFAWLLMLIAVLTASLLYHAGRWLKEN